jgi:hypothetical protein
MPPSKKWEEGVAGVHAELEKLDEGGQLDEAKFKSSVAAWQQAYGFTELTVEVSGGQRTITGAMSTKKKVTDVGRAGTKAEPFPLMYPKPRSQFPTLYFGKETDAIRTQAWFKQAYDDPIEREKNKIKRYVPFPSGGQELPDGKEIGIRSPYDLTIGSLVGPLAQEGTTGGYLINDRLRKYGFRPNGMQGDHFHEIQYGGKNKVENLWPLDKDLNRAGGNYLKNLEVTLPSGKKKKVSELKANVREYWFEIKGFRQP